MNPNIEAYVNGELSEMDQKAFEAAMANDPALQKAVDQQRELAEALYYLKLKKSIQAAVQNTPSFGTRKYILALLVLVILGVVSLIVWSAKQSNAGAPGNAAPVAPENTPAVAIADDSIKDSGTVPPHPHSSIPQTSQNVPTIADKGSVKDDSEGLEIERYRGLPEEIEPTYLNLVERALKESPPALPQNGRYANITALLNKGKYDKALYELQKHKNSDIGKDTLLYLNAMAELKARRPSKALNLLYELNVDGNPFQQEAQWAACLCYLLVGKFDSAVVTLEMIAQDKGHRYHGAAQTLLDAM